MFVSKHLSRRELEHQSKIPTSFVSQNNRKLNASNLFMRNLRANITEEDIRREFSKMGEVLEIKLMNKDIIDNETKEVRGTKRQGFVRMADQKAAEKAIAKFHQEAYFGSGFHLDYWQDRNDLKQEKLQQKQNQVSNVMVQLASIMNL